MSMRVKERASRRLVYRHSLVVRLTHWINLLCLIILLASGLQIFNAHPALYWGDTSTFNNPALAMRAKSGADGSIVGVTTVGSLGIDTTGVLGASTDSNGDLRPRGFPDWITLPSYQDLATGRRWHFFFAWLFVANALVYLIYAIGSGHLRRDLAPDKGEVRRIGASIVDHLRLRFPKGEEATRYNVLQKLAYLGVIFVVLPLLVFAGLTMSPGIDAAFPWLVTLFGGRRSARTIHFICAWTVVLFVAIHVAMVLLSGVFNNMRSMITGWYAIRRQVSDDRD